MKNNQDKTKYKKCPLNKFDICIGEDCAFYDTLKLVEQDNDMAIFDFDCCSIAYMPYVFDKLKILVLHMEKLQQKIDKVLEK